MKVNEVIRLLDEYAPATYQEKYDNAKLIVGDSSMEVTGVLISLDCLESVVDEAIEKNCNLVVSHHPILFAGLKSITGKNYIERTIIKAIKNDIALFACHTNLDNVIHGVNHKIADKLGLTNRSVLAPKSDLLSKLIVFAPASDAAKVREAMFAAGAGHIGDYDKCSFNTSGEGTFRASENTNPHVGEKNELHIESESKIEVILPKYRLNAVIAAMQKAHPYEEVAYDIFALENSHDRVGSGMVGELEEAMDTQTFLNQLKKTMKTEVVRYTKPHCKEIKRVAVCGGAGSFLLENAIRSKADIFITADFKYHQFFDADDRIIIADIGHYESEQFTIELLYDFLKKKINTFAVYSTQVNTNPINYL